MATSVQILGPDNVLRGTLAFSTTRTTRFFTGTLPEDTVDVEVSLFGQPFTSDPTLVSFQGTGFAVPNPSSYPEGLDLFSGTNEILVRAVFLSGTRSTPASATVTLLPANQSDTYSPPTGVTLERLDGSVTVTVRGLSETNIVGYNFYASSAQGGSTGGYSLLNVNRVITGTPVQNAIDLYTLTADAPTQTATPLYYRAVIDQENSAETVLSTDVDSRVLIPSGTTSLRSTVTVASVETVTYYSFQHVRTATPLSNPATIFNGVFAGTPSTELLYYVATAIYYDSTLGVEYESYYSTEVAGAPAQVRQQINGITAVSRQQILERAIASIYRQNPDIAVQPGSVVRDTFLDPFTTEAERLRLLLDYVYRASSFDTLLLIDDPAQSGASQPPDSSAYKTALAAALFYSNVDDVQNVIDGSFDKIAANFNVFRLAGTPAVGEVRFYTPSQPTRTVQIPLGTVVTGGGVEFRTTRTASLPVSLLASFYNPSTRQYSVTVPVRAISVGSSTNVGPNQLTNSNVYGMSVTNDAATFGGANLETNARLAARARSALASVDTGTTLGYLQTAAGVSGTIQNMVVRAGDPLMQRDYDPVLKRHVGGKVDVWARGLRSVTVTDTFSFTYQRRDSVQFVVIGNPLNYVFRVVSEEVTPDNPLAAMLNYPSLGLGLRDVTTGTTFDLTNVTYLNFNTIQLDATLSQPAVTLTDILLGDFRFRLGNRHLFARQPVNSVLSVVGDVIGSMDFDLFTLVHPNGPMGVGCSTKAGDYLQINQSTNPTAVTPSGNLISMPNEPHIITGSYTEYLNFLGAETLSIVVTDRTGSITYNGPYDPSGSPDYLIVEGTATTAAGIKRTVTGAIQDGQVVLISYSYYENFVVSYTTNLVTSVLQQELDDMSHATADVLAKQAISNPVDITATVILKKGVDRANADIAIRNNLQYLAGTLKLGDPMRRSDVIGEIDGTVGVSYVVMPLTKMVRQTGCQIVRNDLTTGSFADSFLIPSWSNGQYQTWLILEELMSPTSTGGGPTNEFRGVYQDDAELTLQLSAPQNLALAVGQAYLIGNEGLVIPGYGTDAVKNRVLVSLPVGDSPTTHSYWCTYITSEDTGDKDLDPNSMEFLVLGDLSLSYDTDMA